MAVPKEPIPSVIGHDWAVDLFRRALAAGRISQSYLLVGPPRIGKTTLALYVAQALDCLAETGRPCGVCSACRRIGKGLHPDVRVVEESGASIRIDQVRELQREMILAPVEGPWRVYVVGNFQKATVETSNCLLKTLEEPPPRVVLILTATQIELLLPTIISRCQVLNLRPLPVSQVQAALETHWGVEPSRAALLARLSEGRIGWAIEANTNDGLLQTRDKYLLALEQALSQDRTERMGLAQRLASSPQPLSDLFDLWQGWWRDLLLIKTGNESAVTNVDRQQTLESEAKRCTVHGIHGSLRAIQNAAQQIEQNVSPGLALEVLLLRLPHLPVETS